MPEALATALIRDGEFFLELLFLIQAGVIAVTRQKFLVFAEFHDAAAIENGDLVGIVISIAAQGEISHEITFLSARTMPLARAGSAVICTQ